MSKGAAKLTHDLGETVTSVVISEDNELFAAGATNKKAIVMNVVANVIAEFTAESGINASAIGGIGREARLVSAILRAGSGSTTSRPIARSIRSNSATETRSSVCRSPPTQRA